MPSSPVNLQHFNHLYADLDVDGKQMGIVHIYSTFPAYDYAAEPKEGFACVDDVSRAIVMLTHEWQHDHDPESLRKIKRLTEFVLHLQNANGYFNNFLWSDLRINLDYKTSVAELNWWSLRALWSLEEVYPILQDDPAFAGRLQAATAKLVSNLERDLLARPHVSATAAGMTIPTWLPSESGADQAAEALMGLVPHYLRTGDPRARRLIESLADGIRMMQKGRAGAYPYGMFLSWRNTWHAWGNIQAYALLMAGERLRRPDYVASGLKEVANFYPYLLRTGMAQSIELRGEGQRYAQVKRSDHEQIAYGIRPMVFAALKAYALTQNVRYKRLAIDLGAWLTGKNRARTPMVDPATGIVFDGILSDGQINRNSGAESTIEALMILQALRDGVQ